MTIDPSGFTRAQLAGRRCAVPNCRKRVNGDAVAIGCTPSGDVLMGCADHLVVLRAVAS